MARRRWEFVPAYLELDEYGVGRPDFSYPTLSLYLDSDGLDTYWHTIAGHKNRFKLRLRYYDEDPETPVFFEVKRRVGNVSVKDRARVRKEAVQLARSVGYRQHRRLAGRRGNVVSI